MTDTKKQYAYSITIIGVLFFIFGFVTWLNGTLIPFLKLACDLKTDAQALLVTFAFYMAYFFLAIPSSYILNVTGFKKGMSLGLLVLAGGAFIFIPAANERSFAFFLTGLFVQGMGLSILQTASNPYIAVVGPIESAAKRISIMGICNKFAGVVSPLILSAIVLSGASQIEADINSATDETTRAQLMDALAQRVVMPYLSMGIILIVFAILIYFSALPEIDMEKEEKPQANVKARTSIFQYPYALLGALCIFLYVGAEVMAGDVIGIVGKSMGMSLDETKNFTAYTLAFMVIGYIIGIITIPKYLSQDKALKYSAITGMVFVVLAYVTSGYVSILFIALLGFANSLMWPAIWPLAIDGLGKFTKLGSALLVMGIAGAAVVPQIYGALALTIPAQTAFLICVLPCYFYILYYSWKGHLIGKR